MATDSALPLTLGVIALAGMPAPAPAGSATELFEPPAVPFEQVVAHLRELHGRRDDDSYDNLAYDRALRDACRCLGIAEFLGEVSGVDVQIERVRVEWALIAAGVSLSEG